MSAEGNHVVRSNGCVVTGSGARVVVGRGALQSFPRAKHRTPHVDHGGRHWWKNINVAFTGQTSGDGETASGMPPCFALQHVSIRQPPC